MARSESLRRVDSNHILTPEQFFNCKTQQNSKTQIAVIWVSSFDIASDILRFDIENRFSDGRRVRGTRSCHRVEVLDAQNLKFSRISNSEIGTFTAKVRHGVQVDVVPPLETGLSYPPDVTIGEILAVVYKAEGTETKWYLGKVGTAEMSFEMEKWWERNDHPLLNNLIVSTLFEFMRGVDLKECRLVCEKWCEISLPFVRSKFSVRLNGNGEENKTSVTNFVEVFRENTLGIPFERYILDPFCTTEGPGQEFLQICESTPKILHLIGIGHEHSVFTQFRVDVEDISELVKTISNIEQFGISHRIQSRSGDVVKLFPDDTTKPRLTFLKKLVVYDKDPEKTSDYCPTFIEELLFIAPNISEFEVRDSRHQDRSRISQVLKAIEKFERESVIRNLHFVCGSTEHIEALRRLAEHGLKLKKLDFTPRREEEDNDNGSFELVPLLAKLFKNSIERLVMDSVCPSFVQLPHMPKLRRLEFQISKEFDSKSANLNKLFPALRELELYYSGYKDGDEWEAFLPNSDPCPNVKSLSLGQVFMRIQLFDHILKIFPKLTKLELDVKRDGVQILRKIMTQTTQLENLSLNGRIEWIESIDAFLTGIPVEKVQKIEHVVTELKEMTVQLRADTIQHYKRRYCQFPSITNLTNLKRLHLSTTGRCEEREDEPRRYDSRMTDVLLYFGLYSMKHINRLEIDNCEFTKSGCEILTPEMGLESWTIGDIVPDVE